MKVCGAGMEAEKTDGASAAAAAHTARIIFRPDRAGGRLDLAGGRSCCGGRWLGTALVAEGTGGPGKPPWPREATTCRPGVREPGIGVCVGVGVLMRGVRIGLAAVRDVCASDRRAVRACVVQIYTYGC